MDILLIVLRLLHIVLGVLWAGWAFALALFVEPAVRAAGPVGGAFMQTIATKTRLVTTMTIAPVIIIVSGTWLLWRQSDGFSSDLVTTGYGIAMTIGGLAGYAAFILGAAMIRPASMRLGAIARAMQTAGAPPSTEVTNEIAQLQRRIRIGGRLAAAILGLCVSCMAIARYVAL
jgi:uncharacterized membrane protein